MPCTLLCASLTRRGENDMRLGLGFTALAQQTPWLAGSVWLSVS